MLRDFLDAALAVSLGSAGTRAAFATLVRALLLVLAACAGTDSRHLADLRGQHTRALDLATRDDDQPRAAPPRPNARVVPTTDPRVPLDLPPAR